MASKAARGYSAPLDRCPYAVLGISRSATLAEVRTAYRLRARDWHPDKHPGDVEGARARFLEVVASFELLSDEEERRHYDATGETTSRQYREQQRRWQQWRRPRAVLTAEHRRAMARVVTVKSRKHLEDVALGESGRVDRHLVVAVYEPGECEEWLTYTTMFPYPFADKLDEHGIWWEDVLQTAKARMRENDGSPSLVARHFGLEPRQCPSIVFARNGSSLWEHFDVLRRPDLKTFEAWLWPKLATTVNFVNEHSHSIRVFWIRGTQTFDSFELAPGAHETRTAYISHLFAARDVRAGGPLSPESVLAWRHVDNDADPFLYKVRSKCVDWHGECAAWAETNECDANPLFMAKFCPVSCGKVSATATAARAAEAAKAASAAREAAQKARRLADDALRRADEAAAAANQLESDAVAAEIVAEAQTAAVTGCPHTYPERVERRWSA